MIDTQQSVSQLVPKNKTKIKSHDSNKERTTLFACISTYFVPLEMRLVQQDAPRSRLSSPDTQVFRVLLCFHRCDSSSLPITCRFGHRKYYNKEGGKIYIRMLKMWIES